MNHSSASLTELEHHSVSSNTPEQLLRYLFDSRASSCLQIAYGSIIYFVYLNRGKLIYATNSLAPFERLERHLRRLSNQNSFLTNETIKQGRSLFRNNLQQYTYIPSDYQAIFWLLEQNYLSRETAITLLRRITREVFESLLSISSKIKSKLNKLSESLPQLCDFELIPYMEQCQQRLQAWQAFAPEVWSSYQRLYLVRESTNLISNFNSAQNETICKLLTGLNFRQISVLIDKDELVVAKIK